MMLRRVLRCNPQAIRTATTTSYLRNVRWAGYDAKAAAAAAAAEAEAEERIYSAIRVDNRVKLTLSGEGYSQVVYGRPYQKLIDVILKNDIRQLPCLCNGKMVCTTCHVYIDNQQAMGLPPASDSEADLIDKAGAPTNSSRLACQISLTRAMSGSVIGIPPIVVDHMNSNAYTYATADLAHGDTRIDGIGTGSKGSSSDEAKKHAANASDASDASADSAAGKEGPKKTISQPS